MGRCFVWKEHVKWRGIAVDEQIIRLGRYIYASARHTIFTHGCSEQFENGLKFK
jgi:hypothetical protein